MSASSNGPFYVLLGDNEVGILHERRPPKTALGAFADLLPIVVACALREHAVAVNALNAQLSHFSPQDAHALAFAIQQSALNIPNLRRKGGRIYAIRRTLNLKETGVWIGFEWDAVEANIGTPLTVEKLTGKLDAKEALIYMLEKDGFNFPLRANKQPIPRPWTLLGRSQDAPLTPRPVPTAVTSSPTQVRSAGLLRESQLASTSKGGDRTSRKSSSSDDSFSRLSEASNNWSRAAVASMAIEAQSDAGRSHDNGLAIQVLTQLIAPPASMSAAGENIFRFPVTFGVRADKFLMLRAATEGELWSLLRVRVHASNLEQFGHHFALVLGHKFSATDAIYLWHNIKFPCL
ncbi:hypothetical protein LXA43DRAFT_905558 [Ganoderma leucocontextum]|nr:hypothetical protein LXA43DRAFT_905558 [Ganoderma leucocontextum]